MILTDKGILAEIEKGTIVIEPYDREYLGTNSYDVHLSKYFATYDIHTLDAKKHNTITHFEIPEDGFVLQPGTLYLGSTLEYTETHAHVPFLEGKSSMGRLGIDIPVSIYAGMPVGQLIYFVVDGDIENAYNTKPNAKYNQRSPKPMESMMWKNFK